MANPLLIVALLVPLCAGLKLNYEAAFEVVTGLDCPLGYRHVQAISQEKMLAACSERCLADPDCGGYTWKSNDPYPICGLLRHQAIMNECELTGKNVQTNVAVKDTRIGFSTLESFSQQPINLRCPDYSVISNLTRIKIGNTSKFSSAVYNIFFENCVGKQSCSVSMDGSEFLAAFFDECQNLNECEDLLVEVACVASSSFNEDLYFKQWSSAHWSTANALKAKKQEQWKKYVQDIPQYPANQFSGRGVVLVAGGPYLEPALVVALRLREMGFTDAIQFWHIGAKEVWPSAEPFLRKLNVQTMDFLDYVHPKDLEPIPANVGMRRFQLKPLALLLSNLQEILLIDADNIPIRDPTYLFDSEEFKSVGTVFWPDYWTTSLDNPIWQVANVSAVMEWEQESGQLLINKEKAWKALHLCVHMNSEFYMQLVNGDKDSFRFAWKAAQVPYHMITSWPSTLGNDRHWSQLQICGHTMLQHDIQGEALFVHHNQMKDLLLPVGENFKYVQDRTRECRAVPKTGFVYGKKVISCFAFESVGISFIDDVVLPIKRSHLEVFELRYAAALRAVRSQLRPDRVRERRNSGLSPTSPTGTVFQFDSDPSNTEYASNCTSNQTVIALPSNSTDRYCNNTVIDYIEYTLTVNNKTASNAFFGTGSSKAFFVQKGSGAVQESPSLLLSSAINYKFTVDGSVTSDYGLIITPTPGAGSSATVLSLGITGSPAFGGGALTFKPSISFQTPPNIYYGADSNSYVGNQINVNEPVWDMPYSGSTNGLRFNTAFNPNVRLFELVHPDPTNYIAHYTQCKIKCATDVSVGTNCAGFYMFATSTYVKCYGLSDLGEPTKTKILFSGSFKKVENPIL